MKCLLVFDHINDIIYTKYNKKFASHVNNFAKMQGLLPSTEKNTNSRIGANVIVQIFSPIITSQRIMSCQFGNSYTSIECEDGLNIIFEEYMGYLFVCIGKENVSALKRFLNTCIALVKYTCGPDVLQLKNKNALVTSLVDSWVSLHGNDQSFLVEAVEQLSVNSDLSSATLRALRESIENITNNIDCTKLHAIVIVQNKFLGLYSSPNAKELSSADILFLMLLAETHSSKLGSQTEVESETDSEEEFFSPSSSPMPSLQTDVPQEAPSSSKIFSHEVLLEGTNVNTHCLPHLIHICTITDGINLIYVLEVGNAIASSNIYDAFFHLHMIQTIQIQRDVESLRPAFDNLDLAVKRLCDSLKKLKHNPVESSYKQLAKMWEFMRKKYLEFLKNASDEALLRAETSTSTFLDNLRELFAMVTDDKGLLHSSQKCVADSAKIVSERLLSFNEFLKVKAIRNFSLGSRGSLTINKYLEEFPGLVHFLYVDRTNHRLTAPSLDFSSDETNTLTKRKIWSMIEFSRTHLQEGHLSIMWKDTTFNYTYFLWFEDLSGSPMKPTVFPSKVLPQSGIFCGDFYFKLKEACFPKISPLKIRCYELFCVHLGLATASCVLEHTRRLAATIWELKGHPNHPIDLL